MKEVVIYTDGACLGNPGPGGWGAVLECLGERKMMSGSEKNTTNNRMELMAAIEALNALKSACIVYLYTDSKYVQQGITAWMPNWKKRQWRSAAGKPVKNQDLWQALDQATQAHQIDWRWVKGHAGCEGNELADQLAVNAAKEVMV